MQIGWGAAKGAKRWTNLRIVMLACTYQLLANAF
jgi:hypothetical protein